MVMALRAGRTLNQSVKSSEIWSVARFGGWTNDHLSDILTVMMGAEIPLTLSPQPYAQCLCNATQLENKIRALGLALSEA
jgi:hypothetical protein